MAQCAHYHWRGGLPMKRPCRPIAQAHVLVHTSREGGAHAILEAVCSGTPVLASRIPGNVGMLGLNYDGYFALGDAAGLAQLLLRCRDGCAQPQRAVCADPAPMRPTRTCLRLLPRPLRCRRWCEPCYAYKPKFLMKVGISLVKYGDVAMFCQQNRQSIAPKNRTTATWNGTTDLAPSNCDKTRRMVATPRYQALLPTFITSPATSKLVDYLNLLDTDANRT